MTDFVDLIVRAIADPGQVLPRIEGESVARWGARAVEATLEAAEKEFVDGQVAQANILGWRMDAGVTDLQVSIAMETAAGLVSAAKTFLTATGAENYVEQHVHDRETGERYTLTIQRPGKKTPHELRREAEAERDQAVGLVGSLVGCAEHLDASERQSVLRPEGCGWCGGDHLAELSALITGSNPSSGESA